MAFALKWQIPLKEINMARAAVAIPVEPTAADNVLAATVGKADQTLAIREGVRRRFDEALFGARNFEQALVVLFTQGIELGQTSQAKRKPRLSRAKGTEHEARTNGPTARAIDDETPQF